MTSAAPPRAIWPLLVAGATTAAFLPGLLSAAPDRRLPAIGWLLAHAAVAALAWYRTRVIGVHYGTAWIASLLFALHPLQVAAFDSGDWRKPAGAAALLIAWTLHDRARSGAASLALGLASLAHPGYALGPLLWVVQSQAPVASGIGPRWTRTMSLRYPAAALLGAGANLFDGMPSSSEVGVDLAAWSLGAAIALPLSIRAWSRSRPLLFALALAVAGGAVYLMLLGVALGIGHAVAGLARPGRARPLRAAAAALLAALLTIGAAGASLRAMLGTQSASASADSGESRPSSEVSAPIDSMRQVPSGG